MPPLHRVVVETFRLHRIQQYLPVRPLRTAHQRRIGVRPGAEEVERSAHVHRRTVVAIGIALQHGQVHGGTTAVARHRRDVLAAQLRLVELGIVGRLGAGVGGVIHPAHEMRHRPRRPVAIEDLQAHVAAAQRRLHTRQRVGRLLLQVATRRFIAIHRRADEVVVAEVLDVLRHVRHQCADIHHARIRHGAGRRQRGAVCGAGTAGREQQSRKDGRTHQLQLPTWVNARSS